MLSHQERGLKKIWLEMANYDNNICTFCNLYLDLGEAACPQCHQSLVSDAQDAIAIWRLGEIEDGLLGPICSGLREIFNRKIVIQPAFIDERSSIRSSWNGISSVVFLNQIRRRHRKGVFVNLGVTSSNVVPDSRHNFLFGQAYMGLPAAVLSLHPLSIDAPSPELLAERALKIAVHEIGHTLGLDHHSYDEDAHCCMTGDEEIDSLEGVDEGSELFCQKCQKQIARFRYQAEEKNR